MIHLGNRASAAALAALLLAACPAPEAPPAAQAAALVQQGEAALAANDLAGAEAAFTRASQLAPTAPAPPLGLGEVRLRQGRDVQAVLDLKTAAELGGTDPRPRTLLGKAYLRTGRVDLAVAALDQAVKLGDAGARVDLARALLRAGRPVDAEAAATAATKDAPTDGAALAVLGEVKAARGDDRAAADLLDRAVKAGASDPSVRLTRARFFLARDGAAEAQVEAEAAQRLEPSSKEAATVLARALGSQGKHDDAARALDVALGARPDDADLLAAKAESILSAGAIEEARVAADRALQVKPDHPLALLVRALAVERLAEPAAAIKAFEAAVQAGAGAEALSRLAALYRQAGQNGDALATYERIVREAPDRTADAVGLLELRAETGIGIDEGLRLVRKLRDDRPGDLRLLRLQTKLEGLAAARPERAPKGPEIIRGGR